MRACQIATARAIPMRNALARAARGGGNMVYAIFSASVLLAIGAIYVGAIGWLYFRQERLLFEPDPTPAGQPCCTGGDPREFFIEGPGARLSVAHMQCASPRGVFFFQPGNSVDLKKWFIG